MKEISFKKTSNKNIVVLIFVAIFAGIFLYFVNGVYFKVREIIDKSSFSFEKNNWDFVKTPRKIAFTKLGQYQLGIEEGIKEQINQRHKKWDFRAIEEFTRNESEAFKKGFELSFRSNLPVEWAYLSIFEEGNKSSKLFKSFDKALDNSLKIGSFVNRKDFVYIFKSGFENGLGEEDSVLAFEKARAEVYALGEGLIFKDISFDDYVAGFNRGFESEKSPINSGLMLKRSLMEGVKSGDFYSSAFEKGFNDGLYASSQSLQYLSAFVLGLKGSSDSVDSKFNDIFQLGLKSSAVSDAKKIDVFKNAWQGSGLQNGEHFYTDSDGSKTYRYSFIKKTVEH